MFLRLRIWWAKRVAIFLTRRNLCSAWRVRLIDKLHDLTARLKGDKHDQ
jgi:hypothetical protein